ncbi:Scm-like with four MBT domains protein 2 [Myotis davidii]|uniref:Scm-like with four MBT domains protein 2 n=1 Tax=Myotis davidii TaxID=225400 RepID=L5LCF6_MYODS|nr:Scm-like with four MBT domains protein 2 [Myotis davidii]
MESSLPATNMPDPSSSPLEKHPSSANGNGDFDSEEGSSLEEIGFNWGEYLEETGASAAPHTSFKHVEISIQSNFQPGMKLEVANKNNPDTYWVATVITTCGQLLLLRYCGYGEDRRADFWCDVVIADLHPVGWCTQNNKALMPPDAIKEKYTDWTEFLIRDLTGSRTAPANLLEGPLRGKGPIDLITVDSLIELQDSQNPFQYWIVSVIENVGGRLRLRYVGLEDTESYDQWLFYLDYRLRPVGWCQENKYRMDPPSEIYPLKMASEWKYALEKSLIDAAKFPLPMEVFKLRNKPKPSISMQEMDHSRLLQEAGPRAGTGNLFTAKYSNNKKLIAKFGLQDHADLRSHFFTVGMKLETVNMSEPFHICPASVTKVFNNHFFQVTIDDLRPEPSKLSMLCHADSLGIFPVQWCLKNGVNLTPPKGYSGQDFDWADYHKQHGTEEAPPFCFKNTSFSRGFTKNMKLEAVNPRNPGELCVASVVRVKGRLLWLHLEGLQTPAPEFIVDVESMDIFPVGWCEANSYPLTTPHKIVPQQKRKIAVVQPEKQLTSTVPVEKIPHDHCLFPHLETTGSVNGKYCCPQLFINHRCFSGPYLNKGRIAELPQSVGPGKCVLVLKEETQNKQAWRPGTGEEPADAPSGTGVFLWDPGPCCMEGGTCEYRQPSSDRHVMKRENSDPVLLVEMKDNTSLGRIVGSLKAVDVKEAQLERPLVLSMIINAAYKPGRVLRELQLVEDPHWNFQEETLKANSFFNKQGCGFRWTADTLLTIPTPLSLPTQILGEGPDGPTLNARPSHRRTPAIPQMQMSSEHSSLHRTQQPAQDIAACTDHSRLHSTQQPAQDIAACTDHSRLHSTQQPAQDIAACTDHSRLHSTQQPAQDIAACTDHSRLHSTQQPAQDIAACTDHSRLHSTQQPAQDIAACTEPSSLHRT